MLFKQIKSGFKFDFYSLNSQLTVGCTITSQVKMLQAGVQGRYFSRFFYSLKILNKCN